MIDLSKYEDMDAQEFAYQHRQKARANREARAERRKLAEIKREARK